MPAQVLSSFSDPQNAANWRVPWLWEAFYGGTPPHDSISGLLSASLLQEL